MAQPSFPKWYIPFFPAPLALALREEDLRAMVLLWGMICEAIRKGEDPVFRMQNVVRQIAALTGASERTAYRWVARLLEANLDGKRLLRAALARESRVPAPEGGSEAASAPEGVPALDRLPSRGLAIQPGEALEPWVRLARKALVKNDNDKNVNPNMKQGTPGGGGGYMHGHPDLEKPPPPPPFQDIDKNDSDDRNVDVDKNVNPNMKQGTPGGGGGYMHGHPDLEKPPPPPPFQDIDKNDSDDRNVDVDKNDNVVKSGDVAGNDILVISGRLQIHPALRAAARRIGVATRVGLAAVAASGLGPRALLRYWERVREGGGGVGALVASLADGGEAVRDLIPLPDPGEQPAFDPCPACGADLAGSGWRRARDRCPECGADLRECPACGELAPLEEACPWCGADPTPMERPRNETGTPNGSSG